MSRRLFSPTSWALAALWLVVSGPSAAQGKTEAAPSSVSAALKEAADLVQVRANTRANLKRAITLYEETQPRWPTSPAQRVRLWTDLSRAWLRLGDLYPRSDPSARISRFEKGQAAAEKALALRPDNADARFWRLANLAKIGQTRGITKSLLMAKALKKGLREVLQLDPQHHYARQTLARLQYKIPGILGGDDDEALALLQECLKMDPNFTPCKYTLADYFVEEGEPERAAALLREVIAAGETTSLRDDWRKFTRPNAEKLLRQIEAR